MPRAALAFFIFAGGISWGAFAQSAGTLAGEVVDATTQAPLSGAMVVARSPSLLGEQAAITDQSGAFEMTLLPPGTYALSVKRDGFNAFAPEGLVLKGRKLRIRLALMPHAAPASAPAPEGEALEFNESMTAPSMVSGPDPEYTQQAFERGIEGMMQVRCVVTAEGSVRACKVLKGVPFMDRAVIDALQRRRYKPALAHGRPVDVYYTFSIRLRLPQER